MSEITETEVPLGSLSAKYVEEGGFVDCYFIDIPKDVTLDDYIGAFYTTSLFKVERSILSIVTGRRASDSDAVQLSQGTSKNYSIWSVENRESDQILLCDSSNSTRSWLMVKNVTTNQEKVSRLYFGSVVVPNEVSENGQAQFGFLFHALGGFHKLYSRALLHAAYKKLLAV